MIFFLSAPTGGAGGAHENTSFLLLLTSVAVHYFFYCTMFWVLFLSPGRSDEKELSTRRSAKQTGVGRGCCGGSSTRKDSIIVGSV